MPPILASSLFDWKMKQEPAIQVHPPTPQIHLPTQLPRPVSCHETIAPQSIFMYPVSVSSKKRKQITTQCEVRLADPNNIITKMYRLIIQRGHRDVVAKTVSDQFKCNLEQLNEWASHPQVKKSGIESLDHGADNSKIKMIQTIYTRCSRLLKKSKNIREFIYKTTADQIEALLKEYLETENVKSLEEFQSKDSLCPPAQSLSQIPEGQKPAGTLNQTSFTSILGPIALDDRATSVDHLTLQGKAGDVVLILGDNHFLRVHADLLKQRSALFDELISNHYTKIGKKTSAEDPYQISLESLLKKEEFGPISIVHLIHYFYSNHTTILNLKDHSLLDLWRCANCFLVKDVAQMCIDQLKNGRYHSPVVLFVLAKRYGCQEIAEYARELICLNPDILNTFLNNMIFKSDRESISYLEEILQSDQINLHEYTLVQTLHFYLNEKQKNLIANPQTRSNNNKFAIDEDQEAELFEEVLQIVQSTVRLETISAKNLCKNMSRMTIGDKSFFSETELFEAAKTLKSNQSKRSVIPHLTATEIITLSESSATWDNLLSPGCQPHDENPPKDKGGIIQEINFYSMELDKVYSLPDSPSNSQWDFKHFVKMDRDGNLFWNFDLGQGNRNHTLLNKIYVNYRFAIIYKGKEHLIYPTRVRSLTDLYQLKEENFQLLATAELLQDCLMSNNKTIHLWFSPLVYKSDL